MDVLQITRSHVTSFRTKYAWWNCKLVDGVWQVHFHADNVPSEDYTVAPENLFTTINSQCEEWIDEMNERFTKI
jgi:hypothetical protein